MNRYERYRASQTLLPVFRTNAIYVSDDFSRMVDTLLAQGFSWSGNRPSGNSWAIRVDSRGGMRYSYLSEYMSHPEHHNLEVIRI